MKSSRDLREAYSHTLPSGATGGMRVDDDAQPSDVDDLMDWMEWMRSTLSRRFAAPTPEGEREHG